MVFGYRLRGLLSPLLNSGNTGWFLDTVFRSATEACEEFDDTLEYRGYSQHPLVNRVYQEIKLTKFNFVVNLSVQMIESSEVLNRSKL